MNQLRKGKNKIIIAAGGSGGHIFPALSVWEILSERHPDMELTWVGSSHRMESTLVPSKGINFIGLRQTEIRRKLSLGNIFYNLRTLWFLKLSIFRSIGIVRKIKPDFVLTTGGFAAGSVGLAAWLTHTPLVIIEPNVYPGMTNRYLGKHAKLVFTAYRQAEKYFPENITKTTGSPARREIMLSNRDDSRKKLGVDENTVLILAMGGSQGAKGINSALPDAIKYLVESETRIKFKIVHQCGKGKSESVIVDRKRMPESIYEITEFINDVPLYLSASDIVISRAGASTLSEIACRGAASILIPFPESAENHQVMNAREWEKSGAAVCIEEKELTKETLGKQIELLIKDARLRKSMGDNAREFGDPSAAETIADCLEYFLNLK
ncbi:MAG: undecaprenyldiphospho-muramoylpentapeptide beta-N-acetylglucosaminyltransferase [bacterium]|nr:undecaprenyldiphospho-muramoylpentapeptide beta-N-acetylglucosaminyltransferase [bacterium]